jgi:hypothetical protein
LQFWIDFGVRKNKAGLGSGQYSFYEIKSVQHIRTTIGGCELFFANVPILTFLQLLSPVATNPQKSLKVLYVRFTVSKQGLRSLGRNTHSERHLSLFSYILVNFHIIHIRRSVVSALPHEHECLGFESRLSTLEDSSLMPQ